MTGVLTLAEGEPTGKVRWGTQEEAKKLLLSIVTGPDYGYSEPYAREMIPLGTMFESTSKEEEVCLVGLEPIQEPKLAPGPYSVFVMHSGGEWEQPTFILDVPETEEKLLRWAEARFSGFQASLLGRDEDVPDHVLASAYHYPGDV